MANPAVNTVAGPMDPSELGATTMHEHILTVGGETFRHRYLQLAAHTVSDIWDEPLALAHRGRLQFDITAQCANLNLDDDEVAFVELCELRQAGGCTVVEASGIGMRSDPRRVAVAAAAAEVNVVMSTGFYCSDFWPPAYHNATVAELTALLLRELQDGIGDTTIMAGHIKCGVSSLDEREHRALLAAAAASQETGAPVTVHPGTGDGDGDGRRVARILLDAGVDPGRLVLAHADAYLAENNLHRLATDPSAWTLKLDYHHELLDLGVTLAFDCFGQSWSQPDVGFVLENDWHRLAGVTTLLREGFGAQIVLGTDIFMSMLTRRGGGHGYRHLFARILPLLRMVGAPEEGIEQMIVRNPQRLLTPTRSR
ncbi:hypothetical protein [Nocardia sp. NPDC047648]|uniref:phosphotriesterase family protein n=1 Tax=Nocardia sp. NPDC047648 TaxID=3155625 RepID=UPI0033FD11E8